jgi:flagellar biogenesis protein FliO
MLLVALSTVFSCIGFATAQPKDNSDSENSVYTAVGAANESASASSAASSKAKKNSATQSSNSESQTELNLQDYQDPGQPQKQQSVLSGIIGTIWNVIKYAFYLGLVLAVGFLAIYGVKFFTTKYNTLTGGGQELVNVVEVRYIAPGKAICLVEIAGKVVVLGVAGNNINHLSDIDEPEQVEFIKHKAAQKPEPLQPFQSALEKVTNRFVYAPAKQSKKSKSARPARTNREPSQRTPQRGQNNTNNWADDLHSTGDNIRKLLDDIKEQEKRARGTDQPPKPGRGDERR